MKAQKKWICGLALLLAVAACFTGCNIGPEARARYVTARLTHELSLGAVQTQNLQAIKRQWLKNQADRRQGASRDLDQIISMVRSERLDRSQAKQILEQKLTTVSANAAQMVDLFAEFHDSLAPEQREKLALHFEDLKLLLAGP